MKWRRWRDAEQDNKNDGNYIEATTVAMATTYHSNAWATTNHSIEVSDGSTTAQPTTKNWMMATTMADGLMATTNNCNNQRQ